MDYLLSIWITLLRCLPYLNWYANIKKAAVNEQACWLFFILLKHHRAAVCGVWLKVTSWTLSSSSVWRMRLPFSGRRSSGNWRSKRRLSDCDGRWPTERVLPMWTVSLEPPPVSSSSSTGSSRSWMHVLWLHRKRLWQVRAGECECALTLYNEFWLLIFLFLYIYLIYLFLVIVSLVKYYYNLN